MYESPKLDSYFPFCSPLYFCTHFYRPQRSCGQGYVFTRVCDSVHGGGGLQAERTPPDQAGRPPGTRQSPPGPGRENLPPPGSGRETPRTRQTPPGSRLQHTVNERPVRILLECILVFFLFTGSRICVIYDVLVMI